MEDHNKKSSEKRPQSNPSPSGEKIQQDVEDVEGAMHRIHDVVRKALEEFHVKNLELVKENNELKGENRHLAEEKNREVSSLEGKLAQAGEQISRLKQEFAQLCAQSDSQIAKLKQLAEEKNRQVSSLGEKLAQADGQISRLKQEFTQLRGQSNSQIAKLKEQFTQLEIENQRLRAKSAQSRGETHVATVQTRQLDQKNKALSTQLSNSTKLINILLAPGSTSSQDSRSSSSTTMLSGLSNQMGGIHLGTSSTSMSSSASSSSTLYSPVPGISPFPEVPPPVYEATESRQHGDDPTGTVEVCRSFVGVRTIPLSPPSSSQFSSSAASSSSFSSPMPGVPQSQAFRRPQNSQLLPQDSGRQGEPNQQWHQVEPRSSSNFQFFPPISGAPQSARHEDQAYPSHRRNSLSFFDSNFLGSDAHRGKKKRHARGKKHVVMRPHRG